MANGRPLEFVPIVASRSYMCVCVCVCLFLRLHRKTEFILGVPSKQTHSSAFLPFAQEHCLFSPVGCKGNLSPLDIYIYIYRFFFFPRGLNQTEVWVSPVSRLFDLFGV